MPELPEVETVVRELATVLPGAAILRAKTLTQKIRVPVPKNLDAKLKGQRIAAVTRRAKYILIHLDNGYVLVIHLGMSGRIHIHDAAAKTPREKHDHFVLYLSDGRANGRANGRAGGREMVFNDPRRFGLIDYVAADDLAEYKLFSHLGPEPLSKAFTPAFLAKILAARKGPVKVVLMDQTLIVGVGNIYASEALFDAGIDPETPAQALDETRVRLLVRSIRKVLKNAIAAGGSTLKDYRKTNGDLGYFQHRFAVYDRAGKACGKCTCDVGKTGGVQKSVQAARSTFYCPRKQV